MSTTAEIVHVPKEDLQIVRAEDFMPVFDIQQAVARQKQMSAFIGQILQEGRDYGIIPGTKDKSLLKPGAEKLCTFFGLSPRFVAESILEDWTGADHGGEPLFYCRYKCELYRGDRLLAEAVGSCNSREKKYRYRNGQRVCPSCGQPALIQGKQFKPTDPKEWLCWAKKGGCGSKFPLDDPQIASQEVGQVVNPDIFDQVNTIQKMAQKRALVAAILIGTNASDSFNQDMEDEAAVEQPAPAPEKGPLPPSGSRAGGAARARGGGPPSAPPASPQPAEGASVDDLMPPAREIPEELRDAVAKLRAGDFGMITKMVFEGLQRDMIEAAGRAGDESYMRTTGKLRERYPKGTAIPPDAIVDCWLTLWEDLEAARIHKKAGEFVEGIGDPVEAQP